MEGTTSWCLMPHIVYLLRQFSIWGPSVLTLNIQLQCSLHPSNLMYGTLRSGRKSKTYGPSVMRYHRYLRILANKWKGKSLYLAWMIYEVLFSMLTISLIYPLKYPLFWHLWVRAIHIHSYHHARMCIYIQQTLINSKVTWARFIGMSDLHPNSLKINCKIQEEEKSLITDFFHLIEASSYSRTSPHFPFPGEGLLSPHVTFSWEDKELNTEFGMGNTMQSSVDATCPVISALRLRKEWDILVTCCSRPNCHNYLLSYTSPHLSKAFILPFEMADLIAACTFSINFIILSSLVKLEQETIYKKLDKYQIIVRLTSWTNNDPFYKPTMAIAYVSFPVHHHR